MGRIIWHHTITNKNKYIPYFVTSVLSTAVLIWCCHTNRNKYRNTFFLWYSIQSLRCHDTAIYAVCVELNDSPILWRFHRPADGIDIGAQTTTFAAQLYLWLQANIDTGNCYHQSYNINEQSYEKRAPLMYIYNI